MKYFMQTFSVAALTALALASCGIDSGSHYDPDSKTFGHEKPKGPPLNDPSAVPAPTATPPIIVSAPTATPSPDATPAPSEEPEVPPPSSGHDVLASEGLSGYFDGKAIKRVVKGEGSEGSLVSDTWFDFAFRKIFGDIGAKSEEQMSIEIKEDGRGRQIVTETATTEMGDKLNKFKGSVESQSGVQKLYWSSGSTEDLGNCPKTFICVDRIEWIPFKGRSRTFCFKDVATGKPIVVPYAPNPNFGPEAFKASLPDNSLESKPFYATQHPGIAACDAMNLETQDQQLVQWKVSLGDLRDTVKTDFFRKAKFKPLKPDTEIVVEYGLYSPELKRRYQPNGSPFLEDVTRFYTKSRYFLESTEHVLAKLVLTIQSAASVPLYTTTTGLQLEYHQEFCVNKHDGDQAFNHCTGR